MEPDWQLRRLEWQLVLLEAGGKLEFKRKANGVFDLGHGVAGKLS